MKKERNALRERRVVRQLKTRLSSNNQGREKRFSPTLDEFDIIKVARKEIAADWGMR